MSELALSASFEYLCYASTTTKIELQCGYRLYTYRRQILTSEVAPRAERVDDMNDLLIWEAIT